MIAGEHRPRHRREPMMTINREGVRLEVFEGPDLLLPANGTHWVEVEGSET